MSILAVAAAAKAGRDVTALLVKQMFTEALTPETIEMLLEDPDALVGAFTSPAVVRKFFANDDFQTVFFNQTASYRNRAMGALIGQETTGPYDTLDQVGGDHRVVAAMCRLDPAQYADWAALVADPVALDEIAGTTPRMLQFSTAAMDAIAASLSAVGQVAATQPGREFLLENAAMRSRIVGANASAVEALTQAALAGAGLEYILADLPFMAEVRKQPAVLDTVNAAVKSKNNVSTWALWVADAAQFDAVFADSVKFAELLEIPEALHAIAADAPAMAKVAADATVLANVFNSVDKMNILATYATARTAFDASATASAAHTDMSFGKHVIGLLAMAEVTPSEVASWEYLLSHATLFSAVTASSTAMNIVAASSTAMNSVAASSTAMNSVAASSTAMNIVAASSTAMNIVAASSTAMNSVAASTTAMNAVAASSTARSVIGTSGAAYDAVAASNMAIAKLVAGAAGLSPSVYADMNAVAASTTAMNIVAASSTAMNSVAASSTAMNSVAASSTAMNSVAASSTAMTAVAASSTAMNAVAASSTAMNAVAASSTAMNAVVASSVALTAVHAVGSALTIFRAGAGLATTANAFLTGADARASASGQYDATYAAWKAFNNSTSASTEAWLTPSGIATDAWVMYSFPAAVHIHKVVISTVNPPTTNTSAKDIRVEYQDAGGVWQSAISATLPNTSVTELAIKAPGRHAKWRVYALNNWGNVSYLSVSEFSLTGFA